MDDRRPRSGVLVSRSTAHRRPATAGDGVVPGRVSPCRVDDSGSRELPQPRVPPSAARAHPARAGHVLDLARADVRARGALDPDSYYELAVAVYREMLRPASPASGSSTTCTTDADGSPYDDPNAMGSALVAAARDAGIGSRCSTPATWPRGSAGRARRRAASLQRRRRRTLAGARRRAGRAAPTSCSGRRSTRCARCRCDQLRRRRRQTGPRPAARAPVRAGRGERRVPGRLRLHPDARCWPKRGALTRAHQRRARDAPDRRPTSGCSARRGRYACFCPTTERDLGDGIGPARALQSAGSAADARQRQPRGDRPVRGDAGGRAGRAAGDAGAAATGRPPSCWPRHPATGTRRWASPTPVGSSAGAGRPGHPRHFLGAHGRHRPRRGDGGVRRHRGRRRLGGERRWAAVDVDHGAIGARLDRRDRAGR